MARIAAGLRFGTSLRFSAPVSPPLVGRSAVCDRFLLGLADFDIRSVRRRSADGLYYLPFCRNSPLGMQFWDLPASFIFLFLERVFPTLLLYLASFQKYFEKIRGFRKFSLCKEQKMGYNKV
jgi:hypothetical protein